MDIIYSGLTLLKEMNWYYFYFYQYSSINNFPGIYCEWIYKMKHLSEMKINRNDIKRKTVHKFKYLQYWIFLIHENWSVLMLMKWQLWQKCYYLLPWIFLHVVYIWYSHYFLWICFLEKCFVSKLSKYLWGFPVYSIYNNAFMSFFLYKIFFGGGGLKL